MAVMMQRFQWICRIFEENNNRLLFFPLIFIRPFIIMIFLFAGSYRWSDSILCIFVFWNPIDSIRSECSLLKKVSFFWWFRLSSSFCIVHTTYWIYFLVYFCYFCGLWIVNVNSRIICVIFMNIQNVYKFWKHKMSTVLKTTNWTFPSTL